MPGLPCSRQGCANNCMVVNKKLPTEERICTDCWISDQAHAILAKALYEVHDLGFDVQFTETEASGLPVTMETVELERRG